MVANDTYAASVFFVSAKKHLYYYQKRVFRLPAPPPFILPPHIK